MVQPPVLRHESWQGLISELAMRDGLVFLRGVPVPVASAVLAAPAAIARWLALRAPQLALAPSVSILVIGAETTDAPDQGRWYQLLPQLLGTSVQVAVTLVGTDLDTRFASAAAAHAPGTPAQCVRCDLTEFLAQHDARDFDLAVVFQPGLQKHRGWLVAGGFARLISSGVPLFASSYEADEYEMERWVLECYGYRVSAEALLNPFFLDLSNYQTCARWGRALWQIEAAFAAGFRVNHERLAALDTLTRMVMHSMTEIGTPSQGYGMQVELQAAGRTPLPMVHVFDGRFVDLTSGRVVHLAAGGELREAGCVPPEVLLRYPGRAARDIERAVWAAEVKSRYLLGSYPPREEKADSAATARRMFDALREKAVSLFR